MFSSKTNDENKFSFYGGVEHVLLATKNSRRHTDGDESSVTVNNMSPSLFE
jgi:hypothetical protein